MVIIRKQRKMIVMPNAEHNMPAAMVRSPFTKQHWNFMIILKSGTPDKRRRNESI
jgi:hypothetical protein